jgi:hypothetical protein
MADIRDAYPGVNAVTLKEMDDPVDARQAEISPQSAPTTGITPLELCVLAKTAAAQPRRHWADALAAVRDPWSRKRPRATSVFRDVLKHALMAGGGAVMPVLVQYISATTIAGKARSPRSSAVSWQSVSWQSRIAPARGFPPLELRFALEYSAPPDFAAERSAIAQLLESEEFTLQPLFAGDEPELARILLLRFPGIERTLSPETLFSIAYDLADARALVRAEPDLGSRIFADPPPLTDELRPEAADALGALCWVDADTPADKRWALETIGVLRAWARLIASTVVPLFRRE